jgi:hypothetical protein
MVIDLPLDKHGKLACDKSVLWAFDQLPHITEAQKRFKELRDNQ